MRLLWGLAAVLLLVLGCTEDSQGDATAPAAPVDYPATIAAAHTQAAAESASVATPLPGSSEAEGLQGLPTALVSRVIDGDTVELGDGSRVRYIGIDTPETAGDCYNREATARNIELVLNRVVQLDVFGDGPVRPAPSLPGQSGQRSWRSGGDCCRGCAT
jgi:endonuclease YncB( thermonuclease family)